MQHPFLSNVFSFLLAIFFFGFCVFIHEFGHLLAALWRKLHVERFSLGFGNAIWKREYKGVEYRISWIPLGGYVALPQLEPVDEPETFDGRKLPPGKPVDRMITAFAGPLFNLLSAFVIAAVVWQIGLERVKPMNRLEVAEVPPTYDLNDGKGTKAPNPEADVLKRGDVIVAVNGTPVKSMRKLGQEIVLASRRRVKMDIIRDGKKEEVEYTGVQSPDRRFRGATGIFFNTYVNTMAYGVKKTSGAYKAGIRPGDYILEINGERVVDAQWVVETLGALNPDPKTPPEKVKSAHFKMRHVERDRDGKITVDKTYTCAATPTLETVHKNQRFMGLKSDTEKKWVFGISPGAEFEKYYPTPWAQVSGVFSMMGKTIRVICELGFKVLGGPVGIAHRMTQSFRVGFGQGLFWVVMISVSLAVFNLLPLPVLDGGHIAIALIEIIVRRRMPARIMRPVSYVFFSMLICLILFVTFYDTRDLVGGSGIKKEVPSKVKKSDAPAPPTGQEKKSDATKPTGNEESEIKAPELEPAAK